MNDIVNFFEQQFALYPYKFLDLEKVCEEYIMKHGFDKDPTEVGEKLEKVLIEKPIHLKIDPLRRMTVIYRFQIFFPTEYHEEFMGYDIQVGENGRLQELHWSDTVYFGEPMRKNVIAYLTELSSTSLRYRPIEELANGYEKWREANLNLETPIKVDSYLYWRIPEIVEDVMKMENLSDVLKVTLMMLTGTPITKEFRNRLIKMNKIITDEKERIVLFQEKKDTNAQLQQSYSQLRLSIQQLYFVAPPGLPPRLDEDDEEEKEEVGDEEIEKAMRKVHVDEEEPQEVQGPNAEEEEEKEKDEKNEEGRLSPPPAELPEEDVGQLADVPADSDEDKEAVEEEDEVEVVEMEEDEEEKKADSEDGSTEMEFGAVEEQSAEGEDDEDGEAVAATREEKDEENGEGKEVEGDEAAKPDVKEKGGEDEHKEDERVKGKPEFEDVKTMDLPAVEDEIRSF